MWVRTPDVVGIKVAKSLNLEPEVTLVEGDHVEMHYLKKEEHLVSRDQLIIKSFP